MEKREMSKSGSTPNLDEKEQKTRSDEHPLPASPTFEIEVIPTDPTQEPVSTHNFCTSCRT